MAYFQVILKNILYIPDPDITYHRNLKYGWIDKFQNVALESECLVRERAKIYQGK